MKLVIDWFENQSIDRGWNAGFRRFFPKAEIIGYQGFIVSPHYLCMYPTKEEKDNRVIPHKVAVIGRGLVQSTRRFCSELDVCIAPAFRFQHIWQKREYFPAENVYTILVALPFLLSEAVYVLKMLAYGNKNDVGIQFWMKPHPAKSKVQIEAAYGVAWPKQFEFVSGDFKDCLEKSNLVIMSSTSSTCMETLAKSIPVIVIGNNSDLTHNPIPETITSDIWRLCYSPQEVADAIQFYQNRNPEEVKEHEEVGRKIRKEYFEPATRNGAREFLRL